MIQNVLYIQLANTSRTDIPKEVKNGKKLKLPSNLYIWATMNTSDQSLFPIDSAFKRRWDWKYLKIKEGKDKNGNKLDWIIDVNLKNENGEERPVKWWAFIKKINEIIASMTSSADKQLGYFFCKADKKQNETDQDATIISEDAFVGKVLFYLLRLCCAGMVYQYMVKPFFSFINLQLFVLQVKRKIAFVVGKRSII